MHLSAPFGSSVNDHISKEDFTLKYSTVDNAIVILQRLGPSAAIGKIDIKHAFRLCPVLNRRLGPVESPLEWSVLRRQAASLRSTFRTVPVKQASGLASLDLRQRMRNKGRSPLLGRFFVAAESMVECDRFLQTILKVFNNIRFPLAPEKVAGQASVLTFLGFELDVLQQELCLPPDKLADLLARAGSARLNAGNGSYYPCWVQ